MRGQLGNYGTILMFIIPIFLLFIFLEKAYAWYFKKVPFKQMDLISSLSAGFSNSIKDSLGIVFVILQFVGFGQIVSEGYYFTGPASSITTTFLYVVTVMHLLHLAGGIISLLIIIYNHFKQKYNSTQTIGIELGAMYWHFLDVLWVYLFLFLFFFK